MFWIYLILIFISGGSGIGFMIQNKYTEAIIALLFVYYCLGYCIIILRETKEREKQIVMI